MTSFPSRLILAACLLTVGAKAQVYIGDLDLATTSSTFQTTATSDLSTLGWTEVDGGTRTFAGSSNTAVIADGPWQTYTVRFDTGVTIAANTSYELSFDLGFMTGVTGNTANYSFQLGTLNGSEFTGLDSAYTGSLTMSTTDQYNIGSGNVSTASNVWTTGASPGTDNLAVQFSLLSYNNPSSTTDFFGFDNVALSASAVPEPSTYAALFGGLALAGAVWHRRRATRRA